MGIISIQKIGITKLKADAVVNAANEQLAQGGGVCHYIFTDAGAAEMTAACSKYNGCKTGHAVITPGFNLSAKYVIHAVGPRWYGGNQNEPKLLYSAYKQSLIVAKDNDIHSIGFPLLSSGIFGYPKDKAWRKALQACQDFIDNNPDYDIDITFCVLDDETKDMGENVMEQLGCNMVSFCSGIKNDYLKDTIDLEEAMAKERFVATGKGMKVIRPDDNKDN